MTPIEIPRRLRRRPRQGGLPVPYVNMVGPEGADFRTLDDDARARCASHNLCGLCGEPLGQPVVLIGSVPDVEARRFFDPPMHEECALYAVQACPFLADPARDYSKIKPRYLPEGEEVDTTYVEDPRAAARLALVWAPGAYVVGHRGTGFWTVHQIARTDWSIIPSSADIPGG